MKFAVITGASSGLGETFARKLAARGCGLLLAARRVQRLEALRSELQRRHGVEVDCFPCDLSKPGEAEGLAARIEAGATPDLLVNNAGFGTLGFFHETDYARQVEMVNLHVLATMRLTRAVLPGMIRRGSGAIINVSSVAGFWRSGGNVSYCATKGWMNDFTEGLRIELDLLGSPVKVQALCPGFTYTEFHDVLGVDRNKVPRWLWMDADSVVEASLRGLEAGKLFVIPGWQYRIGAALGELLPFGLRVWLERKSPHKRR
ncbi:MAG: SDR family oxidoreductase [Bryobacteraceae bacterium]|nr:SDR family oxidoreductase [Bryobacteraceae bacterium]MCX7604564.1 SDR family oxidoreductase [Bryobacteraceae bacterium]